MVKIQSYCSLSALLLLFLALGLSYSYYTPLWSPPDEERHFAYCEYIAQNHRLPEYTVNPKGYTVGLAHPPLFYLLGSLFFRNDQGLLEEEISVNDGPGFNQITHPKKEAGFPYSGKARTAHLLRLFSLYLSAVTICTIYWIVLTFFPGETIFAFATALFVATIPQFIHIAASVSNENLSTTVSTVYLVSLIYYIKAPHRFARQIMSGILLGLSILSKSFLLFYLPVTACVIIWACRRNIKNLTTSFLAIFGLCSLVGGWWYLRNWLKYDDPFLSKTAVTLYPFFLRHDSLSFNYVKTIIARSFISFFGNFGALQFTIPSYHFIAYGVILLIGIFGLCQLLIRKDLAPACMHARSVLFISMLGGVGFFAFLNFKYTGIFLGRYLFPVMASLAVLTFVGLRSLVPFRWRNPAFIFLSLVLIALNLNVLFKVLKPAYAETLLVEGVNQSTFCCPTPEINDNTTVGQTFISPKNNLSSIRVMFSCEAKQRKGEITFVLKEAGESGKILHQMGFPLKKIDDTSRLFFIFPPIQNSMGKEYMFIFGSPSLLPGQGVSLWYASGDCYPEGRMLVNGKPAEGNLYFQAYHFMGKHPETDWQGRSEIVINQGGYITIRELQLYLERSKEFRVQTITHEKSEMSGKAFENRKSLKARLSHSLFRSTEPSSSRKCGKDQK